ncbi:serine/arginine repetitive matrix protein 1-like [Pongo abelii]|uniref:serine/arginine repetitive matrix protein 1-like n=1 Tax=Pongo abelii TaxID=9601 RepID=UPI003004B49D
MLRARRSGRRRRGRRERPPPPPPPRARRTRAELRSPLAAAPGQPARGRAHKLPAAERRASSCSQPPTPTRRLWPAPGRISRGLRPQM